MTRAIAVPLLALVAMACASVPPPATRSPGNPAHPEAPEAATPPLTPMLMSEREAAASPAAAGPEPHAGHADHRPTDAAPADDGSAEGPHVCPMHPNVTSHTPGTCPVCGMALVERKPEDPKR
jgi:hypothetical protein